MHELDLGCALEVAATLSRRLTRAPPARENPADGVGRSAVVLLDGVCVDVHGEVGAGVAQEVLDRLYASTAVDEQRRLHVAQPMEVEAPVGAVPDALVSRVSM